MRALAKAIQLDKCFARNSKMATKTIMDFREGLCTQYFQDSIFGMNMYIFFVWIYEMEQFKLKIERCFVLLFNH